MAWGQEDNRSSIQLLKKNVSLAAPNIGANGIENGMLARRPEGRWEKDVTMLLGYSESSNCDDLKINELCDFWLWSRDFLNPLCNHLCEEKLLKVKHAQKPPLI